MTTRIQANAAIKAEMKSFEMCVTMLVSMSALPEVKSYLSERGISVSWFKQRTEAKTLVCKAVLMNYCNLHEFKAANGTTYKAIYRKTKEGEIVEAKWSIWRVLCAIDAMVKAKNEAATIREAIEGKKAVAKAEAKAEQEETIRKEVRAEGKAKREGKASIASVKKQRSEKKNVKAA